MPLLGDVVISGFSGMQDHPNGHFFLIGDDDKHYIAGLSPRGGGSTIRIGCAEDLDGTTFEIDEAQWQADFSTWRTAHGLSGIAGTFYMGQGAIPVQGTPLLYIGGYQISGGTGSTLAGGEAYACWLRYRIVDNTTLIVDGAAMYKTGPSPAYYGHADPNWCWAGALINGRVYGVVQIGIGGVAKSYLIELPYTGNVIDLTNNAWGNHITGFAENPGHLSGLLDAYTQGGGFSIAIYPANIRAMGISLPGADPPRIGILAYSILDNTNFAAENILIDTAGCEYWEIEPSTNTVIINQADKRSTFHQPWDDVGKLYDGTDAGGGRQLNDYGAPVVNRLSNGTIELLFGRGFTDDTTKGRWRRWVYNPLTRVYQFNKIYETTIVGGVVDPVRTTLVYRQGTSSTITAALVSWNWQVWSMGSPVIPEPNPCETLGGFTDDDLPLVEAACDIEWPFDDLKPTNIAIIPVQQSIGGGPAPSGNEEVEVAEDLAAFPESSPASIPSIAGFWRLQYGSIPIRTLNQVRKWRETQTVLNGRQGVCCVPFYDGKRAPWEGGNVVAEADSAAFVGDTQLDIHVTTGSALEIGMHFSTGERAYRIVEVSGPGSPSVYSCTIWPPVRADIAQNDLLEFEHPICRMRLSKDDGMRVQLELMRFATPSVEWTEDI